MEAHLKTVDETAVIQAFIQPNAPASKYQQHEAGSVSKYRKIDVRIWNDAKFSTMTDRGKLAFLFVLTHPHMTCLGAMRATVPGLAAELNWSAEAFREAFREALSKGLLKHDETAAFVWLPNFLKYNGPESPNVIRSWDKALELIPECKLFYEMTQQVKAFTEALPEGFAKALSKTWPNQEQEQEQEQDSINGQQQTAKKTQRSACSEPAKQASKQHEKVTPDAPEDTVQTLECVGPVACWHLTMRQAGEWQSLYPSLDVRLSCRKADAWMQANPTRRKTAKGMAKFLLAWLEREQNRSTGGAASVKPKRTGPRPLTDEEMKNFRIRQTADEDE